MDINKIAATIAGALSSTNASGQQMNNQVDSHQIMVSIMADNITMYINKDTTLETTGKTISKDNGKEDKEQCVDVEIGVMDQFGAHLMEKIQINRAVSVFNFVFIKILTIFFPDRNRSSDALQRRHKPQQQKAKPAKRQLTAFLYQNCYIRVKLMH